MLQDHPASFGHLSGPCDLDAMDAGNGDDKPGAKNRAGWVCLQMGSQFFSVDFRVELWRTLNMTALEYCRVTNRWFPIFGLKKAGLPAGALECLAAGCILLYMARGISSWPDCFSVLSAGYVRFSRSSRVYGHGKLIKILTHPGTH